jgi:hypothetical protein
MISHQRKRVARRSIPTEIFYGLPPRHTSLHPDPMTISELRTPTPADTTGPDGFRRNSSAGVANPHNTMTSTRCILQWGSLLDRKRNDLRNYFPSPSGGATIPVTALNTTPGPSVYKNTTKQGQRPPKTASTRSPTTGTPANPAYPTCTYCGKVHQPGCGLTSHPDANHNTTIPWSESVNGKAITRLKGPGASLDIKNRYDTITGQLVPLDNETLSKIRKGLPTSKRFTNSAGGETINLHTIGINRQPPSQPPVTQPADRLAGGKAATDPTDTRPSAGLPGGRSAQTSDHPPCCTNTTAPILQR